MRKFLTRLALVVGLAVPAFAKTTYTIEPGACGAATPVLACSFNGTQVSPTGTRAYATMYADLVDNANNKGRGLEFGAWPGPTGVNLAGAIYQVNAVTHQYQVIPVTGTVTSNGQTSQQVTELTVYVEGEYVDGNSFNGFITLHFSYVAQFHQGGTFTWVRNIESGSFTIN